MRFQVWLIFMYLLATGFTSKLFTVELKSRPSKQNSYHSNNVYENLGFESPNEENPIRMLKSITKEITNFKDLQYFGELYIGSNKQKMTFIYDTGSAWIWVPTELCKLNFDKDLMLFLEA